MSRGKALTTKDLEYIKVHLLDMTIGEIAKALGRHYYTIYNISKSIGIERKHVFTPEEDNFIRKNYSKHRVDYIAGHIGVPVMSIYNRARFLGLKKNVEKGA